MKNFLVSKLSLLMMVVLFVACKKEFDQPFVEEELGVAKKKAPAPCKILSMTTTYFDIITHYTFEYNIDNDPISVRNEVLGTGNPNYFFQYDANNRLTDIIGIYGELIDGEPVEIWQVFEYNDQGQIASSTDYVFGEYGDEPDPNSPLISTTEYTYDEQGRTGGPYDSKGNKILGGKKYKYDNKNNIRQTHWMWMFMDSDYSVNNPAGDLRYNHSKFPIVFDSPFSFLRKSFDKATVVYDCP